MSNMQEPLGARIAGRVRALRAQSGLTLDALEARSGVSRSMLSLVERGESGASSVVLDKIATGLGVVLASLFDPAAAPASPVSRPAERECWRDPESGYVRTNVSPPGFPSPIQVVEVTFPPGARVRYETGARQPAVHQQIWLQDGRIEITVGEDTHRLSAGDCLAMRLDVPITFHNRTRRAARYVVVIASVRARAPRRGRD
jgi:transcriptional regulator with XRE-family HTH domain